MNKNIKKAMKDAAVPHQDARLTATNNFSMLNTPGTGIVSPAGGWDTPVTISKPVSISDQSQGTIVTDEPATGGGLSLTKPTTIGDLAGQLGEIHAAADAYAQAYAQDMIKRYDTLMSTSLDSLKAQGFSVVDSIQSTGYTTASVFQDNKVYLPLQDIQEIENARGNAGSLFLHFNEPAIAKDTAGYAGGTSGTFTGSDPTHPVTPEVDNMPPVIKTPDGTLDLTIPYVPNSSNNDPSTGSNPLSDLANPSGSNLWWLWYVIGAIVIVILIAKFRK